MLRAINDASTGLWNNLMIFRWDVTEYLHMAYQVVLFSDSYKQSVTAISANKMIPVVLTMIALRRLDPFLDRTHDVDLTTDFGQGNLSGQR